MTTGSDPDAAIAAGRAGQARKIVKPRPQVPQSRVKGDPERPATMPVNQRKEMKYADALKKLEAGELKRPVLTELGWVVPPSPKPPAGPQQI